VLEAGSGTKFQPFPLFNIVGPTLGLTRNLGAHHQNPSHVAQARSNEMEDVTIGEAFGIMDILATKLVGSGKVNPFKPTKGEVILPSSFKNHNGLLVKKLVSVSPPDLQLDLVQVEIE
jgi:hypothetical protein